MKMKNNNRLNDCQEAGECVRTRKMKSGLLLLSEIGDRLSEVSSEPCEDGCRNVWPVSLASYNCSSKSAHTHEKRNFNISVPKRVHAHRHTKLLHSQQIFHSHSQEQSWVCQLLYTHTKHNWGLRSLKVDHEFVWNSPEVLSLAAHLVLWVLFIAGLCLSPSTAA